MNGREWQIIVMLAIGAGITYAVLEHPTLATPLMTAIAAVTLLLALTDRGQR